MTLTDWANVLVFPGCALVVALLAFVVQLRAEARWRADAKSERRHIPAE